MISKTALHAFRACAYLAKLPEGRFSGTSVVARTIDAPPNYLGKLLQNLSRAGVVQSRKGLGGGFRLAREPGSIRLLDIVEPIEQVSRWEVCFLGGDSCSDDAPCAVHHRWGGLRDQYLLLLSETTVADLVEKGVGAGVSID